MVVRICEVKRVACYARADTFTEAVSLVVLIVATPLDGRCYMVRSPVYYCIITCLQWKTSVSLCPWIPLQFNFLFLIQIFNGTNKKQTQPPPQKKIIIINTHTHKIELEALWASLPKNQMHCVKFNEQGG